MIVPRPTRLPEHWPDLIKSGVLHAISLASVVLSHARGRADAHARLRVQLEQATTEIALLREELTIKDGRWERSRSRRRSHYLPTQRMRILQLRAARGWTLERTAQVFLVDLQTLLIWMRRLDEHGARALIQTVEPVNRYPDFVRHLVRQLKRLFPTLGYEKLAQILARCIVSDKGRQFTSRSYKRWCRRRIIRRRFGFLGESASLAIVERFIRSMKQECFRLLLVPMTLGGMLIELGCYATWFNDHRPHTMLGGRTPREILIGKRRQRRIETRLRWPHRPWGRSPSRERLALDISYIEGRKHLPVIELRRAA
jgi:hypothetical protein